MATGMRAIRTVWCGERVVRMVSEFEVEEVRSVFRDGSAGLTYRIRCTRSAGRSTSADSGRPSRSSWPPRARTRTS